MPLYLFSLLLHAWLALRLLPALAAWPLAQGLLGLVLLASTVMMPLGLTARRFRSRIVPNIGSGRRLGKWFGKIAGTSPLTSAENRTWVRLPRGVRA